MPDPGPFGETFLEAKMRAIVAASFVNNPFGGCVESVFTFDTHRFFLAGGIGRSSRTACGSFARCCWFLLLDAQNRRQVGPEKGQKAIVRIIETPSMDDSV
jgi:hypothetical protein